MLLGGIYCSTGNQELLVTCKIFEDIWLGSLGSFWYIRAPPVSLFHCKRLPQSGDFCRGDAAIQPNEGQEKSLQGKRRFGTMENVRKNN